MQVYVFRADHLALDNVLGDLYLEKSKEGSETEIYEICYKKKSFLFHMAFLLLRQGVPINFLMFSQNTETIKSNGEDLSWLMASEVSFHSDLILLLLFLWWCRIPWQRTCWPKLFTHWQPQKRKMR